MIIVAGIYLSLLYNHWCVTLLQVAGMQYLHNILGPTIHRVFEERKYVELDPNKLEFKEAG